MARSSGWNFRVVGSVLGLQGDVSSESWVLLIKRPRVRLSTDTRTTPRNISSEGQGLVPKGCQLCSTTWKELATGLSLGNGPGKLRGQETWTQAPSGLPKVSGPPATISLTVESAQPTSPYEVLSLPSGCPRLPVDLQASDGWCWSRTWPSSVLLQNRRETKPQVPVLPPGHGEGTS